MTDETVKAGPVKLGGTTFLETYDLPMVIPGTNEPNGWIITLAGPSHPKSQALFDRQARRANKKAADIERAQVMGRKWKGDEDRDPNDVRRDTVASVVARIVGWSPNPDFEDGKGEIAFSDDAAIDLFMDRDKGSYFAQIVEYLSAEKAFLKASVKG